MKVQVIYPPCFSFDTLKFLSFFTPSQCHGPPPRPQQKLKDRSGHFDTSCFCTCVQSKPPFAGQLLLDRCSKCILNIFLLLLDSEGNALEYLDFNRFCHPFMLFFLILSLPSILKQFSYVSVTNSQGQE